MKKETGNTLKLGVFVVTGLALLIVAVYLIGENQNMFKKTFTISAEFNNVSGLMQGNNVRYSGINIGTVKFINMVNDSTIRVDMNIEEKMVKHIKKDAIATIGTDGLVGNMIVNIIPGRGKEPIVTSGDIIQTYTKIGTEDMLNTLSTTNENAALLTAKLLKVADAMADEKGTLGMLINDTLVASDLKQTFVQLKITSIEASKAMRELNSIISSLDIENSVAGALLKDSAQAEKVKSIITNLDESSAEIKGVLSNLNETITNFKEGEGALNYLSNDKELVENLEEIMNSIEEGTEKFNQNMEALKHNFLTRGYFKKLERQKKKEIRKAK
ncbi:MAG: MCE family protein [Flavobacteriaceae bacterium]|nr:MCE family protein [Bacteroidia bacterium]NNL15943.1 MCE family protein [Flavobacteriaceae bacterium]